MFININLDSVDHMSHCFLIRTVEHAVTLTSRCSAPDLHGGAFMMSQLQNTNLIEIRRVYWNSNNFDSLDHKP